MIVLDTSVLYAATDRTVHHHERCREWIATATDALLIPPTVLAESCYLIDRGLGAAAEATFLEDMGAGNAYPDQLVELVDADLRRMSELVRRYADRHLGGTDASIVAICERLDIDTAASLNHRDFDNLRPRHRNMLNLVPH